MNAPIYYLNWDKGLGRQITGGIERAAERRGARPVPGGRLMFLPRGGGYNLILIAHGTDHDNGLYDGQSRRPIMSRDDLVRRLGGGR